MNKKKRKSIEIYDTTLRDGSQAEGVSFSVTDKVRIAEKLDALGIAYIEAGWPGSNPKDMAFFQAARKLKLRHAQIVAFGSTRRARAANASDPNLKALVKAGTQVVTIFGKTWDLHVREALRTSPKENLRMIESSVRFLKAHAKEVQFDAEHFFDGYKAKPEYALEACRAAVRGGARMVELCEQPSVLLSNIWFGDPTSGDLCYSLRTRARRDISNWQTEPHRAVCPVTIHNSANTQLDIERFCVHAIHLSVFAGASRLWTNGTRITFKGEAEVSQLEYADKPPNYEEVGQVLSKPRTPFKKTLLKRSLGGFGLFSGA